MSALQGPLPVDAASSFGVDRRTIVLGALAGFCASAVAAGGGRAVAAPRRPQPGAYAASAWRPFAGHVLPTAHGDVLLASITEWDDEPFETFRLRFVTVDKRPMPEQLVVRHPVHGRVSFLVTNSGAAGVAVVNRRRS